LPRTGATGTDMITTRFLATSEYEEYASWVKKLNPETRATYFGVAMPDAQIDNLVKGIVEHADKHHFLVAEYKGAWIGTIHIAEVNDTEVEFGFIVDAEHRGNGIADRMMKEALLWSRNRGYHSLYMHCLSWNQPIKRLCIKNGMELHSEYGETETKLELAPPDLTSITEEVLSRNRQAYRMLLQTFNPLLNEIYN
jgi:RimJ/RimL family protein N-acetyltransferase